MGTLIGAVVLRDVVNGSDWSSVNGSGLVPPASSSPHQTCPPLPEIALLEAMVEDAVQCVQGLHRGLSRQEFLAAYEWIASERRDWPFSFLNVCDFLGIDATAMRQRLGVTGEYTGSASQKDRFRLKCAREHRARGGSSMGTGSRVARTTGFLQ